MPELPKKPEQSKKPGKPASGKKGGRRKQAAPALTARDRLGFLLTLVPWLVENDRVTVDRAAAHFRVPPEVIRESVRLIAISGVPGDTAAYQPDDLFDIAWDDFEERDEIVLTNLVAIDDSPRFSAREAAALIAGLQYLSALPENADSAVIATLTAKLSLGASGEIAPFGVERAPETDATLALIRSALERGVQVELDYRSARGETERRRVDPLRLESVDTDWYLRGWCHSREALRTFRLDRMAEVVVTDTPIEHRADQVALPETLFEGSPDDLPVVIEVAPSALPLVEDYLQDAPTSEHGGMVRASLHVTSYEALARLVAGMSGVATVVEPPEARRAVAAWARAASDRYRD
jgi:proteasome accessory factor C